ncbi:hypothetical protein CRG98_035140 [Punica granatum]|uniref:Uncharacterized protein n=1 Tax=Punica granatum TaxID=22663 RepID=A0A2I0IM81_PUNGR|nr:hypothetical protein CRG98_035140 [Punica granatum]
MAKSPSSKIVQDAFNRLLHLLETQPPFSPPNSRDRGRTLYIDGVDWYCVNNFLGTVPWHTWFSSYLFVDDFRRDQQFGTPASSINSAFVYISASGMNSIRSGITTVFIEGRSRSRFSQSTLGGRVDELTQPLEVELANESIPPQQTNSTEELSTQPPCEGHPIEEETVNHRLSTQDKIVPPRLISPQESSAANSS